MGNKLKRASAFIISLAMLAAFTACGDDSHESKPAAKRDNSYTITAVEHKTSDDAVNICYPQISGLYDEKMQDYYNALFKSNIEEYMDGKDYDECLNEYSVEFDCEYEVALKTADILSIVFRCRIYRETAAYPTSYAYAYTINLETGETMIPSKSVDIDNAAQNFKSGENWSVVNGMNKSNIIDFYDTTEESYIKDYLTESEDVVTVKRDSEGNYTKSGKSMCNSYLDSSNSPVIILETHRLIGSYAEIKFN